MMKKEKTNWNQIVEVSFSRSLSRVPSISVSQSLSFCLSNNNYTFLRVGLHPAGYAPTRGDDGEPALGVLM